MIGPGACAVRKLLVVAAIVSTAATPAQPVAAEGQTHRIKMERVSFAPAEITVRVGDTLEWDNSDIVAHTATSKEAGFDVNVPTKRNGSAVIKAAGTIDYICRYHPNMKGRIVVEP